MGATSGLGRAAAEEFIRRGYRVGVCGRRTAELEKLHASAPERVEYATIDITSEDAGTRMLQLIERLGGMDIYFHVSGMGKQNLRLDPTIELDTLRLNGEGFCRMVGCVFRYFRDNGIRGGRIAAVTSIAGTKGLGAAPAYSATKRMQGTYLQCLSQLSRIEGLGIEFTDIRPGFVATPLLDTDTHNYPMLMPVDYASRRIVRALIRGRRVAVIDWRYAILVALWRCIPNCIWERLHIVASSRQD